VKRVAIVGTPGAGESALARELGAHAGLPVIHLDQHHFLPRWQRKSDEEWERIAEGLLAGDRWVMGGAFAMEKA
jgi:adenylate kinase family enzyme